MSALSSFSSERLLTVREAAETLRIHEVTAYRLVSSGQLHSVKIGRRRLITPRQLQAFIAAHTSGAFS